VKTLSAAAVDVIERSAIYPDRVVLPPGQLDRKLYVEVNTALERLGGKWNRSAKAHLFTADPTPRVGTIIETGQMPPDADKLASFWRTPRSVAERLCTSIPTGARTVLEPSAGDGAIAVVVREMHPAVQVQCVEADHGRAEILRCLGFTVAETRFQDFTTPVRYEAVVMNPPFTEPGSPRAWVEHVLIALSLLDDGGTLAAVVPSSIQHSGIKSVADLRSLVEASGWIEPLPDASFRESGTDVSTCIVVVTP